MKYVNETSETLELEWQTEPPPSVELVGGGRYRSGPVVTLAPGNWYEPFAGHDGTHIVIRRAPERSEG